MKLTFGTGQIDVGRHGFEDHDLLGRASRGKQLSDLVERIEDPQVITLDGSWGTGKTHFLKCWTGAHTKENNGTARVIYIDAFEQDYGVDPLVTLVGAVARHFAHDKPTTIERLKTTAGRMALPAFRVVLAALTAGASERVSEVGDELIQAVSNEVSTAATKLFAAEEDRHQAVEEFREILRTLVAAEDGARPSPASAGSVSAEVETEEPKLRKLVLVVDELDRCRPDYALSLLEIAKHFFGAVSTGRLSSPDDRRPPRHLPLACPARLTGLRSARRSATSRPDPSRPIPAQERPCQPTSTSTTWTGCLRPIPAARRPSRISA